MIGEITDRSLVFLQGELSKSFDGSKKAKSLSWPVVENQSDLVAVCLGEILHGLALRKVLAYQAIGVLIGATFPRVVGSGKVERDPGCVLDLSKAMELGSVISSD